MEESFWFNSWETGLTSFHRKDIHPYVQRYATPDFLRGQRVLVPLCGKTNDLLWFREHAAHVIGVELVEQAIIQFFQDNQLPYRKVSETRYEANGITMLCKNIFNVTHEDVGHLGFVYDRAALVALPIDMRLRYVDKIGELMPIGAKKMVITLEYDPWMAEPPFSITPQETQDYYRARYRVDHIEEPEIPGHPMIRKFGLSFLKEHCFMVTKSV